MKCLFKYFVHLKNWIVCLFIIEFLEFFIYLSPSPLLRMFCGFLLPVCDLPVHFLNCVFDENFCFNSHIYYYLKNIIAFCDLSFPTPKL